MDRNCWTKIKNFKPSEFKCGCGCETEHVDMSCALIYALQNIRNYYGVAVNIKCGYRCAKYNASLKGAIKNSHHLTGNAADIQVVGHCNTVADRKEVILYASTLPGFLYGYYNGELYKNGKWTVYNASNMGRSVHLSFS